MRTDSTPADHTHQWTIFFRDANGNDLSKFVKKVVFKLHDTYPSPLRAIDKPPFQVTETGWGEFEITMRVFFVPEASEKNVLLYHHLKLHPFMNEDLSGNGGDLSTGAGNNGNASRKEKNVESFVYDELVFNEPTEAMFEILTERPGALLPMKKTNETPYSQQTENEETDRLSNALAKVYQQVQKMKERINSLESEKRVLVGQK